MLELNKEHIDELIAKYFAGEALPEEAMLLDDWKSASAENLAHFNECRKALQVKETQADTARMLKNIMQELAAESQPAPKVVKLKPFFTPLRIAASLLLVSMVGYLAFTFYYDAGRAGAVEVIAAGETVKETTLADGSKVALNKHARLTVVGDMKGKERRLKLEGEAYFEVKHSDEQPFVIDAGGVLIRDIGTAFNVKADLLSDSVFVSVSEGVVDMSSGESTLRLVQDESAVFVRSTGRLVKTGMISPNIHSYHSKIFSFNARTLAEVIAELNMAYGDMIILENQKLAPCRITVDFNNDSPETIVSVITETLGLSYRRNQEGVYIISGTSCIQ